MRVQWALLYGLYILVYWYSQGPPKAARGHVTAHSANVDGKILTVTKYLHMTWDILAIIAKLRV